MTAMTAPNRSRMEPYWLPFTANRAFKANPRLFAGADGMYYTTTEGKQVLDGMAGLWCVNAGHNQRPIVQAIKAAAEQLDYVSSFQMSHPLAFEFAARIAEIAPAGMDHVFFVNSGSEAVDTALKLARAYFRAKGEAGRTRFIGRAKGYHGMGWGGLSVAGIGRHRKDFGPFLPETDHLHHTLDLEHNAFSKGQPAWGAHLADELESICALHDPSSIAAVIVEPVTGSGGVLPPPKGYLEKLRAICDKYGILLIFDEVITGYGRLGAAFASQAFGVTPDLITCAKGMTNGAVPMGGVIAHDKVWDVFMRGPEGMIELFHGYTYSGHPLACAAGIATLDVYRDQNIFERAAKIAPRWEAAAHALKGLPRIVDIRNVGILAAVELEPRPGAVASRAVEAANLCYDKDVLVRSAGDALVLSPPLIINESEIDRLFSTIAEAVKAID
ncbi:MAG: aspartate aminotransferase family protein [Alphaproteobacteria bacterium]|nr:aspartate aminotransferase family protein [Alphaproteobacteria bacterium]MCW5743617.1 aspartate aminotransferase family protein [Alphaproteobacteria bacterium]